MYNNLEYTGHCKLLLLFISFWNWVFFSENVFNTNLKCNSSYSIIKCITNSIKSFGSFIFFFSLWNRQKILVEFHWLLNLFRKLKIRLTSLNWWCSLNKSIITLETDIALCVHVCIWSRFIFIIRWPFWNAWLWYGLIALLSAMKSIWKIV